MTLRSMRPAPRVSHLLFVCTSQEGDSLMGVLEPYLDTGVNLTTFRFRYEGSGELTTSADDDDDDDDDDSRYDDDSFATVHDSLLTLYHGVRLHTRVAGGGCQWAGSNLISTLAQVITVSSSHSLFCCNAYAVHPYRTAFNSQLLAFLMFFGDTGDINARPKLQH